MYRFSFNAFCELLKRLWQNVHGNTPTNQHWAAALP